jgi:hypothetical protein
MIQEILKLMRFFPQSFINYNYELILDMQENVYFRLEDINDLQTLKIKLISWCSRSACKGTKKRCQIKMLMGINSYLNTNFSHQDMELIYTKLGNACNTDLCIKFIESNYNLEVLGVD